MSKLKKKKLKTWTEEGAIETPHACEAAVYYMSNRVDFTVTLIERR